MRLVLLLAFLATASAQQFTDTAATQHSGHTNDPAAVELFRDRGLGLFIHWGVDGPLGGVISHSLVGASPDYVERFFRILPGYFNPVPLPSRRMGRARQAGRVRVRHVHRQAPCRLLHVGYRPPPISASSHTPYGKDLLRQLIDAFRKQGIAIGIYFSPDDFWWLHQHGITINRQVKGVYPQDIPEFMDYTRRQLKELLDATTDASITSSSTARPNSSPITPGSCSRTW